MYALADEYLDDLPERIGPVDVEYDDPWTEMVGERGFSDVEVAVFEFEREWDIDSIVGYVFSLSYCSPATFGTEKEAFEADLRALLEERAQETLVQDVAVEIIAARK